MLRTSAADSLKKRLASRRTACEDLEVLEVVLTAQCNLRCRYCYQNDKKARTMSWGTLRGALDLLLRSRRRGLEVVFLGGEPLLEFPLIRQAVSYVRAKRPRSRRIRFSLVTNGMLLREEQARFLARNRIEAQLSFDGVPAAQELRGPGTFDVLDRLLERLRLEEPRLFRERLTVALTLTSANMPHLADSIRYFLGKGVAEIAVAPVVTHDPGWRNEMIEALGQQFAKILAACLRHYHRTGEVPLLLFRSDGTGESAMCRAPSGRALAVDVDGQTQGCAVFIESYQKPASAFLRDCVASLRLGDFREPGFAERLERYPQATRDTGIFHDKGGKYSSYGRCRECRFVQACSVCPASIGHIPGNTDPNRIPDFACAFNRVALTYREGFLALGPPPRRQVVAGRVFGTFRRRIPNRASR